MRVAVVGKGGAGKSVIAGTLARLLGRSGQRVLALDSDMQPGLAISLGVEQLEEPMLAGAAERDDDGRWRLRRGIGPVRAVRDFSVAAPDGVRLLQAGKVGPERLAPILGSVNAYYAVIHRLAGAKTFREWAIVGDLPAGPRQSAFGWAPFARTFLVVTEPTWQSALTARRLVRVARAVMPGAGIVLMANKVAGRADVRCVAERVGLPVAAAVPADPAVREAERRGAAPLDAAPGSPALTAIARLAEALSASTLTAS
jgi:CO dehydrogenase maturation factor